MLDKLFGFKKSRPTGVITAVFQVIKSCFTEEWNGLHSMCINTTRSNGLKLDQGEFTLDIKNLCNSKDSAAVE